MAYFKSTNRSESAPCFSVGFSQSALRTHENTPLGLAEPKSKARMTPRSMSRNWSHIESLSL